MAQKAKQLISDFKKKVEEWKNDYPEVPVVYNYELDHTDFDQVELILIADNPGAEEINHDPPTYLVPDPSGPYKKTTAGKIAKDLLDFLEIPRSKQVVLNKSPLHSPLTSKLAPYRKSHPELMVEAQQYMAGLTVALHEALAASNPNLKVWVCGFSDCWSAQAEDWHLWRQDGGHYADAIFPEFFEEIARLYAEASASLQANFHILKHFSMHNIFQDLQGITPRSLGGIRRAGMSKEEVLRQIHALTYAQKLIQAVKTPHTKG